MTKDLQLRLLPEEAANDDTLRAVVERETGDAPRALRILKRSIDARQRTVYVNVTLRAFFDEEATEPLFPDVELRDVSGRPAAIVVGAGPGGLFAALRLIELGMRPIVVERGREVNERKRDIADIVRRGTIDPESNYCFGEGGAGAFSDGKLYTRSKKRGSVERILVRFCQQFGGEGGVVAEFALLDQFVAGIIAVAGELMVETAFGNQSVEDVVGKAVARTVFIGEAD